MEVTIGTQGGVRELAVETELSADEVQAMVDAAFTEGRKLLWLTDREGRRFGIPLEKLAYIQFTPERERRVGFSAVQA